MHYAEARDEPPWDDDVISRAIWYAYQRLRAESRARDLAELEATL